MDSHLQRCGVEGCWRNAIDPDIEFCDEHLGKLEKQNRKKWSVKKIQAYVRLIKIPTMKKEREFAVEAEKALK